MSATAYEAPEIVEVGDFAELTRVTNAGRFLDNPWVQGWWDCCG